ncbi:MAG: iron-sulfur cluster assembly scaffold protein [Gammaproteobacteria bacterium]|nr:iron-sulfur cluster assembly scaffold protein [Gammaproteobacteria bacterium]
MTGTRAIYSQLVRELFERLPHAGDLGPGAGTAVHGEAMALDRGAWVRFDARIEDGRVVDCSFRAWGCPHTLAAAALIASRLHGEGIGNEAAFDALRLARELGAPAEKLGRLLVVEDALSGMLARAHALQ